MFYKDFYRQKKEIFSKASTAVNCQLQTILRDKGVQIINNNQLIYNNFTKVLRLYPQVPQLEKEQKLVKYIAFTLASCPLASPLASRPLASSLASPLLPLTSYLLTPSSALIPPSVSLPLVSPLLVSPPLTSPLVLPSSPLAFRPSSSP